MSNTTVQSPSPSASSSPRTPVPVGREGGTKDNATRLRENQRRSRARKKEYLTSLEARYQACQRTGIEANVEIQNAARRVVRENVFLRGMLRTRGVADDEIDRVVREGGEVGGGGDGDGESAVEGVMKALERRPCPGGSILMERPAGDGGLGDRRNSTGMLDSRDIGAGQRMAHGGETSSCSPTTGTGETCVSSAKCSSQFPLSSPSPVLPLPTHHRQPPLPHLPAFIPQHYPSPGGTPMPAILAFTTPASAPQINPYYNFSSPPLHAQAFTTTRPTYPANTAANAARSYQQFYSAIPQDTPQTPSNCCYQPSQQQQQQYQTPCSTSTAPCHLTQTYIQQLHPQSGGGFINQICPPPDPMKGGSCHVGDGQFDQICPPDVEVMKSENCHVGGGALF